MGLLIILLLLSLLIYFLLRKFAWKERREVERKALAIVESILFVIASLAAIYFVDGLLEKEQIPHIKEVILFTETEYKINSANNYTSLKFERDENSYFYELRPPFNRSINLNSGWVHIKKIDEIKIPEYIYSFSRNTITFFTIGIAKHNQEHTMRIPNVSNYELRIIY